MAKIQIKYMPLGEAPEWVRKEWVGLELPTYDVVDCTVEILGENNCYYECHCPGYWVNSEEAIKKLEEKSPSAAKWWKEHMQISSSKYFVFENMVCTLR